MKLNKFNKSITINIDDSAQTVNEENSNFKKPIFLNEEKSNFKKPIFLKDPKYLKLNEIYEPNYKKMIKYKFYYKNPQFLNNSSIQSQIDVLLTKINNNNSHSLKIFPKKLTISNDSQKTYRNMDKLRKSRYYSTYKNINKNNDINKLPNICTPLSVNFKNNLNMSGGKINDVKTEYKNIFPNAPLFKQKSPLIDNKLNIIYCQNESQYKFLLEKRMKLFNKEGRVFRLEEDSQKIKGQIDDIKTKIKFMKNIMDYSFPSFMLTKLKSWEKNLVIHKKTYQELTPVEKRKIQIKQKNIIRNNYLKHNLNVFPLKI